MNHRPWMGIFLCCVGMGCAPASDLGAPCRLEVPNPADGGALFVSISDPGLTDGSDFISTDDADCDELICIRLAGAPAGRYDDSDGTAHGQCSVACLVDGAGDRSSNCDSSTAIRCQQLSLDQTFLDSFCEASPGECQSNLGGATSASYCVEPVTTPASG